MAMHRAYRRWQQIAAELSFADEFAGDFSALHARLQEALLQIAGTPMETGEDAAMVLEAALSQADLPEPARQMSLDVLMWLQAQRPSSK